MLQFIDLRTVLVLDIINSDHSILLELWTTEETRIIIGQVGWLAK
jgi:exosome complex RNA-binding protein Rrp4